MRFLKWLHRTPKVDLVDIIEELENIKAVLQQDSARLAIVEKMANATRVKVYRDIAKEDGENQEAESAEATALAMLRRLGPGDVIPPNLIGDI